ncbi:phage tail length tape measure family protein, partial [Methylobacterium sp. J-068]|uniref:phage tail length tape measure family protein n=1 Tax=Methylobacterium sp. J-068 TaxID=2836649 RepID=UPI001FBBBCE3
MATNIAIRLQATGGAEIRRELDEVGGAGKTAFDGVTTALDRTSAGADKVINKVREVGEAARRIPDPSSAGSGTGAPSPSSPSPATSREIERLRFQIDEEYRKAKQLGTAEDRIGRGVSGGYFDAAEAERLRGLAAAKYGGATSNDNAPQSRGLNTYDKLFVKYQATDFAQQVFAGTSPVTAAVQQGGQLYQQLADREGGLGAGLKQLGVSALSLVTPFTVGATAVTAMGAAMAYAAVQAGKDQEVLEKATKGVGAATGATASQLDAIARTYAESGKVSASASREIVAGYASMGTIALPVIADLTRVTTEYAKVTGQDAASATAELGRAITDGASGLDSIAAKIGGLDDRTRQLIQTQIEQGDRSGAQATAAEYLRSTVEANTTATTGWAGAWDRAAAAANGYWEAAKRIAGIKLGVAPETATEAVVRLQGEVDKANNIRTNLLGIDPLNGKDSEKVRQLATARVIADQEWMIAEGKAAEERANKASVAAGNVARAVDPNFARLSQLREQQGALRDALADPLARSKLSDPGQTEEAYTATSRAIATMTDATGKMVSAEKMAAEADQLRIDKINAKTDAEKRAVEERQKAVDLIGKTVTPEDARGQVARAGIISALENAKGGDKEKAEAKDDYDRATRSLEDRIRRQGEEAQTYGMGAEAVARYRTEQELLTAAKRAERDVTPQLTAQIQDYVERSGEAAKRLEELRDSSKRTDEYRSIGSDGVRTFVRGLSDGVTQGKLLENVLSSLKNRAADLASNSISDMLFGKRGSGDYGLLSSLFSGGSANAPSPGAQGPTAQAGGLSALLASAKSFFGFSDGGYTGPGGKLDVRGVVHAGEVVFSQDDVTRFGGVGAVEAMRRCARGYSGGGAPYFTMPSAVSRSAGSTAMPSIHFITPPGTNLEPEGPPPPSADVG